MENKGRKVLWVNREIQLRFVLFVLITLAVASAIISAATFSGVWSSVLGKIVKTEGSFNEIYNNSLRKFIPTVVGLTLLLTFMACLGMLILSHKVAGPVYHIIKILKDIQRGKEPNFTLRKWDTLGPVVEELKKLSDKNNELKNAVFRVIESWKNTEVKDMSFNLALKELETKISQIKIPEGGEKNEK